MGDRSFKIVISGVKGTGRTSSWAQWIHGFVRDNYTDIIMEETTKRVRVDGFDVLVEIYTTRDTEQFLAMQELYYKNAQGLIIMYSVTDPDSFSAVSQIKKEYDEIKYNDQSPSVVLVWANKTDLVDQRKISVEHGRELSKELQVPVLEASAKSAQETDAVFVAMIRRLLAEWKQPYPLAKNRRRSCLLM